MIYSYVRFDRGRTLSAIDDVASLLNEYKGEPIVKGEHPIHSAVVALERLCRIRTDGSDSQPQKLPHHIICRPWFRMISSSRSGRDKEAKISCRIFAFYLDRWRESICDGRYKEAIDSDEPSSAIRDLFESFRCEINEIAKELGGEDRLQLKKGEHEVSCGQWIVRTLSVEGVTHAYFGPFRIVDEAETCVIALAGTGKFVDAKIEKYYESVGDSRLREEHLGAEPQ